MIACTVGPSVLNRRRNKNFTQKTKNLHQRNYGSRKYAKENRRRGKGRKPRKAPRCNKYMTNVLSYIYEEESHFDAIVFNANSYKQPMFEQIHYLITQQKSQIVNTLYGKAALRKACVEEYVKNFKPNLTEEKFAALNIQRLQTFLQVMPAEEPKGDDDTAKEEDKDLKGAETFHRALSNFKRDGELKALVKMHEHFPTLMKWKEAGFNKTSTMGEEVCFSVKQAKEFSSICDKARIGHKLHFLSSVMTTVDRNWEERMDNFYYECSDYDWRSKKCNGCKRIHWKSHMHTFHSLCGNNCDANCRLYQCSECILKTVQKNFESNDIKGTFVCGSKSECFLNVSNINGGIEFFEKKLNVSKKKVHELLWTDYERLVLTPLRELPEKLRSDPDSFQQHKALFERLEVIDIHQMSTDSSGDVNSAASKKQKAEIGELKTKIEELIKMSRLKTKFQKLDEAVDDLVAKTKAGNDEAMLQACKKCQTPIRQVLQDRPNAFDGMPKLFGMTMEDVTNMKLQRAKDALTTAYSLAKECGICMTTSTRAEEDLLDLHGKPLEKDVKEWKWTGDYDDASKKSSFRLPCFACKGCFKNYLNFKKSLGKPALKCPAMDCECHLRKADVKKMVPLAYADYEAAIMRFSLKRVNNFRICPNADCSAGLVVDLNCKAEKVTCVACNFSFCAQCNDSPHEGMTCEEMQRKRHEERWGNSKEYMANETKQCPHCLTWIEKNGGCNHMTCHHCRGEFCWLCFGNWKDHYTCDKKKEVVRRPFGELFPHWQDKPKKMLQPRFSPGKYVLSNSGALGRVEKVFFQDGVNFYHVKKILGGELILCPEDELCGYNKFEPTTAPEDSKKMERETYLSFLSGFDEAEDDEAQAPATAIATAAPISVELVLKDPEPEPPAPAPYASFLAGFGCEDYEYEGDSDDEDDHDDSKQLRALAHSMFIGKRKSFKSTPLKELKKLRAQREKSRFGKLAESDDEDSSAAVPKDFWSDEEDSSDLSSVGPRPGFLPLYDSDEEESSSLPAPRLFFHESDSDSSSEDSISPCMFGDIGFSSDDEDDSD